MLKVKGYSLALQMVKLTLSERFIICIQIGMLSYIRNSNPLSIFLSHHSQKKRREEREREREVLTFIYIEQNSDLWLLTKRMIIKPDFLKCLIVRKLINGNVLIKGEIVSGRII